MLPNKHGGTRGLLLTAVASGRRNSCLPVRAGVGRSNLQRPCSLSDPLPGRLPLLVELDADAEVLRYILGRARDASEVHDFWEPICADTDADEVGLSWWIGRRRGDGDFLGWWELSPDKPVLQHPTQAEAGWRLARRHVMLKLGMRHVRTDHREWDELLPGSDRGEVVYEITGSEWTSGR